MSSTRLDHLVLGHPIGLLHLNLNSNSLLGALVLSVLCSMTKPLSSLSSDCINKFWISVYYLERFFTLSLLYFTHSLFGFCISLHKGLFFLIWYVYDTIACSSLRGPVSLFHRDGTLVPHLFHERDHAKILHLVRFVKV
jgi:hypothetical protein